MISGCAEAALVAPADEEPVISVPSSPREVVDKEATPGKDEPILMPGKGREAMVFVQATRVKPDAAIDCTGHSPCPRGNGRSRMPRP